MLYSKLEIPKRLQEEKIHQKKTKINMDTEWSFLILDRKNNSEKTEILLQIIRLFDKQIMWYHLDYLDNKENIFLEYLKENFVKLMKGIEFGELLTDNNFSIPFCYLKYMEHLIFKVTEYISDRDGEKYCLIFDCFHEIENKIIYKMIQQLVDNKPKGLHLVIVSEQMLPQFGNTNNGDGCLVTTKSFKKEESPIFVSFFNGFHVKNMESEQEICWRTKKEKQLFAYFFTLKGKPVDRSHLLEVLWNETIPENGIAMLHNMIYHIRKEMERIWKGNFIQYKKKNTA